MYTVELSAEELCLVDAILLKLLGKMVAVDEAMKKKISDDTSIAVKDALKQLGPDGILNMSKKIYEIMKEDLGSERGQPT